MKDFEKEFNKNIQRDLPVSKGARQAFDRSYQKIYQEVPPIQRKSKRSFSYISIAVIVVLGVSLAISPVGRAMTNFLRFGQFTSKTLQENGFVTQQSAKSINENIEIELSEVYADQNQIGLHFTVQLPKNSKFTDETIDFYNLNFVLRNGDGSVLVDFFSGLTDPGEQLNLFSAITPNSHFDKSTNVLELTYQLKASSGTVPQLEGAEIEVTGLKATYETNEDGPGEYQMETEEIEGSWKLLIDTEKINTFDAIGFVPKDSKKAATIRATAYPSSFILLSEIPFNEAIYFDDMRIVTVENGVEESYTWTQSAPVEENGKEYTKFTFDYTGYDQAEQLTVRYLDTITMEEVAIELERK